jgi:hypothetical protein
MTGIAGDQIGASDESSSRDERIRQRQTVGAQIPRAVWDFEASQTLNSICQLLPYPTQTFFTDGSNAT